MCDESLEKRVHLLMSWQKYPIRSWSSIMQGVFTSSGKLKDEALFTLTGKDGTQTGGCLQTGGCFRLFGTRLLFQQRVVRWC